MTPTLAGVLTLALALLLFGLLFVRRNRAVFFWFYAALSAVGIGYLISTGAASGIGTSILQALGHAAESAAPAADPAPAAAPAPATP